MKLIYIDIIEKVIRAYTRENILEYIAKVRKEGLSEHGFPRLTANIGVLLANERRTDLKDIFVEMMDLCCEQIPSARTNYLGVGNDFSVREIICSLLALEEKKVFPVEKTAYWRKLLQTIDPYTCYLVIAKNPKERVNNWAAFGAASEQVRKYAGIGKEDKFIEQQIASQLLSFDEKGMYRDPHEPMLYDVVTRLQLSVALYFGYDGPGREKLDELLAVGGMNTLLMQSVTGEISFGGRSNQFLYNEAALAAVCEYEAERYLKKGDLKIAGQFKAAANLAVGAIMRYFDSEELHHVKNCFPRDSFYGCEEYAYFNKYMVTTASFLYAAYLFADDAIQSTTCPAMEGNHIFQTSDHFHKTIGKHGEYFVEYETRADFGYDANGLGRIHRKGAPSAICLSVPFAENPNYGLDIKNPSSLSICCGVYDGERYALSCEPGTDYTLVDKSVTDAKTEIEWCCRLNNGIEIHEKCILSDDGVQLSFIGGKNFTDDKKLCCVLPVFEDDGKNKTVVKAEEQKIEINYCGWQCCYITTGKIQDWQKRYANRNGHYKAYIAKADKLLDVKVTINEKIPLAVKLRRIC